MAPHPLIRWEDDEIRWFPKVTRRAVWILLALLVLLLAQWPYVERVYDNPVERTGNYYTVYTPRFFYTAWGVAIFVSCWACVAVLKYRARLKAEGKPGLSHKLVVFWVFVLLASPLALASMTATVCTILEPNEPRDRHGIANDLFFMLAVMTGVLATVFALLAFVTWSRGSRKKANVE